MSLVKYNNNSISSITSAGQLTSGNLVPISEQTASGSASISFTSGIDSTYPIYRFEFINCHPATNGAEFTFQSDTGTNTNYNQTITSTSFQTNHKEDGSETGLAYATPFDQAQGTAFQTIQANIYNANDNGASGTLQIFNPSSTTFVKHFISDIQSQQLDGVGMSQRYFTAGYFNTTTPLTRFQFKMSSGNIDSGTIKLYGIKDS